MEKTTFYITSVSKPWLCAYGLWEINTRAKDQYNIVIKKKFTFVTKDEALLMTLGDDFEE